MTNKTYCRHSVAKGRFVLRTEGQSNVYSEASVLGGMLSSDEMQRELWSVRNADSGT